MDWNFMFDLKASWSRNVVHEFIREVLQLNDGRILGEGREGGGGRRIEEILHVKDGYIFKSKM